MKYILDENNNPVLEPDVVKWGTWFEANRQRRVLEQTTVGKYWVSTVFIGLDHSFGEEPPQLWETMIFLDGSWSDEYCARYATYADAVVGHKVACMIAEKMDKKLHSRKFKTEENGRTEHA